MSRYKEQFLFVLFPVLLFVSLSLKAEVSPSQQLKIADPFLELHTGPGAGYPLFHVVDRGQLIIILRRRTDWFQIQTEDGLEGWASRDQMKQTLLPSGEQLVISESTDADFSRRKWVLGITGGEFKSAPVFTLFAARSFTDNFAIEVALGQSIGSISSSSYWKTNLVMQPFSELSYSPYFSLGLGIIKVSPGTSLIIPQAEDNSFAQFGIGIQSYISRSFLLRLEFNEYVVFSASNIRDQNEEVNEWKIGFAVFF